MSHIPVMLDEVLDTLAPQDGDIIIDGTFGRGGYTKAILDKAQARVYAIDRDPSAIEVGHKMQETYDNRLVMIEGKFGDMRDLLADHGITQVNAIVLDLGISSPQIDEAERGFSFQKDGPLDMRMSGSGKSAADLVNNLDEAELADIFYYLGEERFARRIARKIVQVRSEKSITTTFELADIVRSCVKPSKDKLDPATRSFQALRIAVNEELDELNDALGAAEKLLLPGGRLVVVSFHSLEDRAVKHFLKTKSSTSSNVSRHVPQASCNDNKPIFKLLTRQALRPGDEEILRNARARSARLRAAIKLDRQAA